MNRISRILIAVAGTLLIFSFIRSDLKDISIEDIGHAANLIGLEFTLQEKDSMQEGLIEQRNHYQEIRGFPLDNDTPPAFLFNPLPQDFRMSTVQQAVQWDIPENMDLPADDSDLAFFSILELASLIKNGKISSVELTRFYIQRLKDYGDTLQCVVSITEELALKQAEKADRELAGGKYRGPLHGIPYGVKDLLAVEGYPTTWGAAPYKDQVIPETATVVKKLDSAGAVLIVKLTLGALAWGDVWYGGITKNPWDLTQGSSGSSAGSASATAAGLVPFAIGSETWGSIVSPSTRCGVTGLRPSYGRVSRTGAMALSWTMDKLGPICRTAVDCAIVFQAIHGMDNSDPTLIPAPFNFDMAADARALRIGYLRELFEEDTYNGKNDKAMLKTFQEAGIDLRPVSLPDGIPSNALSIILSAESAAAFDELTRSDRDSLLVRQIKNAWPNAFRQSRFIPAVEYINANRIRYQLIQELNQVFKDYDAVITPSFGGDQLLITNLTGHPCMVLPNGFNERGQPTSFSIIGNLFGEEKILTVAKMYQELTDYENMHPPLFH